jgi:ABC-2 type transport system ATP-binding protein
MIQVQNLSKSFEGIVAVDNLSFEVSPGEVLGFLGPNGAGKTTTMRIITGFIKQDSGSVRVYGHDVQSDPLETKKLIGYLPEGAPAWGEMSPANFLDFIADIRGLQGDEKIRRTAVVVDQLELHSVLHRPIETLSKGFRRRVGIAQALIHDPRVLILDEPTDGLDPNQKHQVRELIRNLATDKIVIVSTHILEEVHAVCARAMIISEGRLVADSTPAEFELQSRYHNAVTLELENPADVAGVIGGLPEVEMVEQSLGQANRYTIFARGGEDIYAIVNEQVLKNSWSARALHVERGRLDDVFRRFTQGQTGEAA